MAVPEQFHRTGFLYGLTAHAALAQYARLTPIALFAKDDAVQVALMALEKFAPGILDFERQAVARGMAIAYEGRWVRGLQRLIRWAVLTEYKRLRHRHKMAGTGKMTFWDVPSNLDEVGLSETQDRFALTAHVVWHVEQAEEE